MALVFSACSISHREWSDAVDPKGKHFPLTREGQAALGLLLVGVAPNAIAYESKQFSSGGFFLAGIPASILLVVVLAVFVRIIWPLMGMPVTLQ